MTQTLTYLALVASLVPTKHLSTSENPWNLYDWLHKLGLPKPLFAYTHKAIDYTEDNLEHNWVIILTANHQAANLYASRSKHDTATITNLGYPTKNLPHGFITHLIIGNPIQDPAEVQKAITRFDMEAAQNELGLLLPNYTYKDLRRYAANDLTTILKVTIRYLQHA